MLLWKLCNFFFFSGWIRNAVVGVDIITPFVVRELVKEAWKDLAPFKKSALQRLHGTVFGSGRAARSTDFVIFNTSHYLFRLRENECETGGWSNGLLPDYVIPPHTSVVFGAQSYKFLSGVTNCRLRYKSPDGQAYFELYTNNAFFGRNTASAFGKNVDISTVYGRGNNNIVRFTIHEHFLDKNKQS